MLRHVRTCSLSLAVEAFSSSDTIIFFLPPNDSWRELRRVLDLVRVLVVSKDVLRLLFMSTFSLLALRNRSFENLGFLRVGLDEGESVSASLQLSAHAMTRLERENVALR